MKQLALDFGFAPGPAFHNFHVGSNAQAVQCVRAATDAVAPVAVPVYVWGETGSGKSHLLRAAYEVLRGQGVGVGWLDASIATPVDFDERWHAVLLDDVQGYNAVQQAAAFNWFVNATSPAEGAPRWILSAGLWPPADLPLRDDLRTRLGWGHVFQLHVLDEAERREVLCQQAKARGLALSSEVLDYMWGHFPRDLGSLVQLLERLDHFALSAQRAVTIPLLKTMLDTE